MWEILTTEYVKVLFFTLLINFSTWFYNKQNYNPGLNISALFKNLVQVRIATSKTTLDILYNTLGTQVAPWFAKQLKT